MFLQFGRHWSLFNKIPHKDAARMKISPEVKLFKWYKNRGYDSVSGKVVWAPDFTAMAAVLSLLPSTFSRSSISTKPRAVLERASKMGVSYGLKQGQSPLFHELPSGPNMEVIVQKAVVVDEKNRELKTHL